MELPYELICDDAIKAMSTLTDESVHLALFSPTYDTMRQYETPCPPFDYQNCGTQLERVLVPGGVIVVLIQDSAPQGKKTLTSHRMVLDWCDNHDFSLFQECVYARRRAPGVHWNIRFREDHDKIMIFFKGDHIRKFDKSHMMVPAKTAGQQVGAVSTSASIGRGRYTIGDTKTRTIGTWVTSETVCCGTIQWYTDRGNALRGEHPATMSDKFARDYILAFSEPEDVVLDPYVGSGTTVVQALTYSRQAIGIDISEKYLDLARRRIAKEVTQFRVL